MVRNLEVSLSFNGPHDQGRFLGRTNVGTITAAHAVQGIHLDAECEAAPQGFDTKKALTYFIELIEYQGDSIMDLVEEASVVVDSYSLNKAG